jgi:hypothetical protein
MIQLIIQSGAPGKLSDSQNFSFYNTCGTKFGSNAIQLITLYIIKDLSGLYMKTISWLSKLKLSPFLMEQVVILAVTLCRLVFMKCSSCISDIRCPEFFLFAESFWAMPGLHLDYARTVSFQILYNSLFTSNATIWCYTVTDTEHTKNKKIKSFLE